MSSALRDLWTVGYAVGVAGSLKLAIVIKVDEANAVNC